jgi:hypothetical protein
MWKIMKIKEEKIDEKFNVIEFENNTVDPVNFDEYIELIKSGKVTAYVIAMRTIEGEDFVRVTGSSFSVSALSGFVNMYAHKLMERNLEEY